MNSSWQSQRFQVTHSPSCGVLRLRIVLPVSLRDLGLGTSISMTEGLHSLQMVLQELDLAAVVLFTVWTSTG